MNIAIIPARSGSKGVPDKNIELLWNIPLLAVAIKCAKATNLFDKIIVSTDSKRYADIAIENGAIIPFLRPANLAGSESLINDVIENLIQSSKDGSTWESICLLEPTSPMRTPALIEGCYNLLNSKPESDSCLSVNEVPLKYNPVKQLYADLDGKIKKYNADSPFLINRQNLQQTFIRNGGVYITKLSAFKKLKSVIGEKALYYLNSEPLLNIDDPSDIQQLREWEQTNPSPQWLIS